MTVFAFCIFFENAYSGIRNPIARCNFDSLNGANVTITICASRFIQWRSKFIEDKLNCSKSSAIIASIMDLEVNSFKVRRSIELIKLLRFGKLMGCC